MHRELDAGAETSECTLKMRNRHTGRYEWQHLIYNRLHGDEDGDRLAVGFTTNVDLQQDALRRYEHELLIRRELIRDSLTFYQINLTTGMIEEYSTKLSNMPVVKTPFPNNEDLCEMLLAGITPEYRQAVRETLFSDALMERYRQGKTSVSLVFRRIVPERGTCWVKCTATIIKKPLTNEIVAFINTASVDGERKDELAIQSIIEDEIEFMLLINVRSGMARVSKYRSAMSYQSNSTFPYDEQILLALDVEAHPDDRALCAAFFPLDGLQKALAQDARARLTYRIADAQGIKRKQARAFYLDDTREDIVLVRRDITDLYEEEQRRQQTLKDAVDLANAANHAKSEFLSRMSHDMRTPLNAIIALSGEDMTADATPPQKDEFLEKIHASGKYLLGIINDVLDMSRIEGNKFSLRPVPYAMEEFIGTINTVIASQCRAKGLRFEFQFAGLTFPWALVDKVRFNQIFINLLTNAIKFTPPGGTVAFVIETLGREGDRVRKRFTVRDSGIGMSREFLPLAFDSFAQENQAGAAEAEQGTGLGLSIVKQIVELMGGTISVESELGKGTTFTVELAYTGVDAPRDDAYDGAEDIPEGLRVLLCEDHALNARITTALLEKKGCTVDCACNGREGLRMFAQSPPFFYGIVLMDIRMPVMDGLAATRAIRALDRRDAARVPIIALTADAFVEDAKTSLDTGMNDHLAKPIEPALLYRTIAKHARRARKEDVCTRD